MPATVSIDRERLAEITALSTGSHTPDHTFCVMEAAAYVAHERWSDHPACACPVATEAAIWLNDDVLGDETRHLLIARIEALVGSRSTTEVEARRRRVLDVGRSNYSEAVAPARKAYDEAVATARKAYDEAVATAEKAYDEAVVTAEKAYDEAVATAEKAYDEAVAPARKAYDEAVAPARKAYDEALAPHRLAALALLDELLAITADHVSLPVV